MSLPDNTDLQWKCSVADEEHLALARQRFKLPHPLHALHDIVLVRVLTDDADDTHRSQPIHQWHEAQQVAVDCRYTQAKEEDAHLNIDRRWIPYKCVFLPDTEEGRKFQDLAQAIGQIPMQAGIKPKNPNQEYWLKTLHHIYQAKGLLVANNIFSLLTGDHHPRKLLQDSIGFRETTKFEQLAAADTALYRLVQAVAPDLSSASAAVDDESLALELLIKIQQQMFINEWNAGPANPQSTWISLKAQDDWHIKQTRFLKKLINKTQLVPREEEYLEEIAQTGAYWQVLNSAITANPWSIQQDLCLQYIKTLVSARKICISDISWLQGQPYKLERDYERAPLTPEPQWCSKIPQAECDCPFRFIGTDLNHSRCLTWAQKTSESLRLANTPKPINGTTDIHGFIVWTWKQ